MNRATRDDAFGLLNTFLRQDVHYLAASAAYGDGGIPALDRALDLFLLDPDRGFVWLAYAAQEAVGVCVVGYAISTSIGAPVAKLDDVFVRPEWQRKGIASAMLRALIRELRQSGVGRIDTAVHVNNLAGRKLYERLGFMALQEERLALVL